MKMRHVTIHTAKLEESVKFYEEIAGLKIQAELRGKGPHDIVFLANDEGETCVELLEDPDTEVKGTVKELAEKYGIDIMTMTGFLDGINDSLKEKNPIDTMEEDTPVSLAFDKEMLYKNMVDAKAHWLYGLSQWEKIFDEETRKKFYLEAKKMNTIVKPKKIGRNDPCPCGSGKKFKKCHGVTKELEEECRVLREEVDQLKRKGKG